MTVSKLSEHRQRDRSLTRLGRKRRRGPDAREGKQLDNTFYNVFDGCVCSRD
jgi:hypothetical protein